MFRKKKIGWIAPAAIAIVLGYIIVIIHAPLSYKADLIGLPPLLLIMVLIVTACFIGYGIIIKRQKEDLIYFAKGMLSSTLLIILLVMFEGIICLIAYKSFIPFIPFVALNVISMCIVYIIVKVRPKSIQNACNQN
jgi:CHASE2 domain-containing sensor protein